MTATKNRPTIKGMTAIHDSSGTEVVGLGEAEVELEGIVTVLVGLQPLVWTVVTVSSLVRYGGTGIGLLIVDIAQAGLNLKIYFINSRQV